MFKKDKVQGQKACVLGLGKSCRAAAALLAEIGFEVIISVEANIALADSFRLPANVSV